MLNKSIHFLTYTSKVSDTCGAYKQRVLQNQFLKQIDKGDRQLLRQVKDRASQLGIDLGCS